MKPTKKTKLTKKYKEDKAREIVYGYNIGDVFSREHTDLFSEFSGVTFDWIKRVEPYGSFNKDAANLACKCDAWNKDGGTFSWIKAVRQTRDNNYEYSVEIETLREIIRFHMKSWRLKQEQKCSKCGSEDNPQVDHKTIPFSKLVKDFKELHGDLNCYKINPNEPLWTTDLKEEWLSYHNTHADYQILCRSCNASKGNR